MRSPFISWDDYGLAYILTVSHPSLIKLSPAAFGVGGLNGPFRPSLTQTRQLLALSTDGPFPHLGPRQAQDPSLYKHDALMEPLGLGSMQTIRIHGLDPSC